MNRNESNSHPRAADYVEVMDTTLRDGEQMSEASYTSEEKLTQAKLLIEEVKVDRVEIASALVSPGEEQAVGDVVAWARENGAGAARVTHESERRSMHLER